MKIEKEINGITVTLDTGDYYFSPDEIDRGTLAMLSAVEVSREDKILDLGCGYGIVGIYLAKLSGGAEIVMSDVSEDAVRLSGDNVLLNGVTSARVVLSDGLASVEDKDFTLQAHRGSYKSSCPHIIQSALPYRLQGCQGLYRKRLQKA